MSPSPRTCHPFAYIAYCFCSACLYHSHIYATASLSCSESSSPKVAFLAIRQISDNTSKSQTRKSRDTHDCCLGLELSARNGSYLGRGTMASGEGELLAVSLKGDLSGIASILRRVIECIKSQSFSESLSHLQVRRIGQRAFARACLLTYIFAGGGGSRRLFRALASPPSFEWPASSERSLDAGSVQARAGHVAPAIEPQGRNAGTRLVNPLQCHRELRRNVLFPMAYRFTVCHLLIASFRRLPLSHHHRATLSARRSMRPSASSTAPTRT